MPAWLNWEAMEVEVSKGGGIPKIQDDLYDAVITEVSEPRTEANLYKDGELKTQFYVVWKITDGSAANGVTLRQYVSMPDGRNLNEKSKMYEIMYALGYDMDKPQKLEPWEWEGHAARILVETKPNQSGVERPRVIAVKAPRVNEAAGTLRKKLDA